MTLSGLALAFASACAAIADFASLRAIDDARGPVDAGFDANQAEKGSPCRPDAHAFCDDFDRGIIASTMWPQRDDQGGLRQIDDASSVSAPYSVRFAVEDAAVGSQSWIGFELSAPSGAFHGRMRVQLDCMVAGALDTGLVLNEILFLEADGGTSSSSQWLAGDVWQVGLNWPGNNNNAATTPGGPGWQHLDFFYSFSDDGGAKPTGFFNGDTFQASIPPPQRVTMQLGIRNHEKPGLPRVFIDNVVIDFASSE